MTVQVRLMALIVVIVQVRLMALVIVTVQVRLMALIVVTVQVHLMALIVGRGRPGPHGWPLPALLLGTCGPALAAPCAGPTPQHTSAAARITGRKGALC